MDSTGHLVLKHHIQFVFHNESECVAYSFSHGWISSCDDFRFWMYKWAVHDTSPPTFASWPQASDPAAAAAEPWGGWHRSSGCSSPRSAAAPHSTASPLQGPAGTEGNPHLPKHTHTHTLILELKTYRGVWQSNTMGMDWSSQYLGLGICTCMKQTFLYQFHWYNKKNYNLKNSICIVKKKKVGWSILWWCQLHSSYLHLSLTKTRPRNRLDQFRHL